MKLAIEASVLSRQLKTGVSQYTLNLVKRLPAKLPDSTIYLAYISFFTKPTPQLGVSGPQVKQRRISLLPGKVYHLLLRIGLGLPFDLLAGFKPDVFLFPNYSRWPLALTRKSVIVVYDLSFLEATDYATKRSASYLARSVKRSVRLANRIIVISEATKQAVVKTYGIDSGKVKIIYPAVDHKLFFPQPSAQIQAVKQKYAITGSYILYTGTIEPRKNIVGLLEAYAKLPESIRQNHGLVLVGGKGWLDEKINQLYQEMSRTHNLIRTGYVPDADLPALYSGATVFVYPSFYEGFGMPPLEAMACGTPVITSDNTSLPEVVGAAGRLIKAESVEQISAAMAEIVGQPGLAKQLSQAGLKQAQKFNWDKSASELAQVLNECYQNQ